MSKNNKRKDTKNGKTQKDFLDRLPSNLPFVPFLRRPDYQLRHVKFTKLKQIKHWKLNATLLLAMIFIGTFFIYTGGFYYLSRDKNYTYVLDPITQDPEFIWQNLNEQTIPEGIAAGILMSTGASGFFLIQKSTQYAYSQNTAIKYLLGGIALVTFALLALMSMLITKLDLWKELFGLEDTIRYIV
ncbi:MAG: hypothetical protein FK734_14470 [Asgard group archaeon]|nr:hypothetical protein [Asgard group archaeon]